MHRLPRLGADHGNCRNNGIGTHGEPAHGLWMPVLLAKQVKENMPGKFRTFGMKGGRATVYVVVALQPGRQGKASQTE